MLYFNWLQLGSVSDKIYNKMNFRGGLHAKKTN